MEPHDDPFARAAGSGVGRVEVTGPIGGQLAARDPDAPFDDSAEFRPAGAATFDDLLRHARMKGFLAGAAAGALGAAAIAIALSLATSRPVATVTIRAIEPRAEPAAPAREAPEAGGAKARPAGTGRRATGEGAASARRAAPEAPAAPAPEARPVPEVLAPGAELPPRAPEAGAGPDLDSQATGGDGAAPAPEAGDAPGPPPPPEGAAAVAVSAAPPRVAGKGKGPFPEREVAEALRSQRAALADCVATTPGAAAAARGHRFALTVVIDPSGRVSDVEIDDPEIEATPLGVCLLRLAQGMSFAPFEGEPFRVELALGYGDSE